MIGEGHGEKTLHLTKEEQAIEDDFEKYQSVNNLQSELAALKQAAENHSYQKKQISIRLSEADLEIIRQKASNLGLPYQTYINMIIHKEATN